MDRKLALLLLLIALLDGAILWMSPGLTLDMHLYYTGGEARAYLAGLSPGQQQAYFLAEAFDLLLILAYSALAILSLGKLYPGRRKLLPLALLPGAFDLLENCGVFLALRDPRHYGVLDWLGVATALKWLGGLGLLGAAAPGLARLFRSQERPR